jgi:plastocyanin
LKKEQSMVRRQNAILVAAALGLVGVPAARAQAPARHAAGPTAAEFAALKAQVERQQELIMRLTQIEGEHYDFLVKLIQGGARGVPPLPAAPAPAPGPAAPAEPEAGGGHAARPAAAGTITGRVDIEGKPVGPVYVYVDNVKAPLVHNHAIQIAQTNKAFVPGTTIVQRGTKVTFPNFDLVLHNVFSPSPTQPFDLGSYRQGEKPGTVTLTTPGVVEIFCNMHAQMRANVLVVPNGYFATVGADGSFKLENVPAGSRRLVAWTPDARPATQVVELTSAGASAKFALKVDPPRAHNKKDNTPYPSYSGSSH